METEGEIHQQLQPQSLLLWSSFPWDPSRWLSNHYTPPPLFLPLISCPRWSAVPQPSCTVPDPKSGSGDPHAAAQLLRVRICRNEEHLCRNAVKCAFICDLCETSEANFLHSARLSASPQLCGYAPLHLGLQECAHVSLFIIVSY